MLLKTILNRIQLHHGFVYGTVCLVEKAAATDGERTPFILQTTLLLWRV